MESRTPSYFPIIEVQEEKSPALREVIGIYLYYWPYFLLSVLIALALSFLYITIKPPVYEINSKVLIKDEKKIPTDQPVMKEMDLFKQNKLVENEIEIIRSRNLMKEVVTEHNLWVSYREGGWKSRDLYTQSPVTLILTQPASSMKKDEELKIKILNDREFTLSRKNTTQKLLFNTSYRLKRLGTWQLQATPFFQDYQGKKINISVKDPDLAALEYVENLDVAQSNKLASVVELSLKDQVPERGELVLKSLLASYKRKSQEEKSRIAKNTLDFITKRLSYVSGELETVERNMEGYRSSQGLTDISSESKVFLDNVQTTDNKLNEVNVKLSQINDIETYLNSENNLGNTPATAGIDDPSLGKLINNLTELQLQREKLLAITPEKNPIFDQINRQIAIAKTSIRENIQGLKSSLISSKDQLQSFNSQFENSIKKLPGQERQLLTIKRKQNIKENLYNYLLQKREEISLSYASASAENENIETAFAGEPVSPMKPLIYALGLFFGLAFPAGIIYGKNALNTKVQSRKEIEDHTTVPIIAELMNEKKKSSLIFDHSKNTALSEQFRSLRTNLKYLLTQHGNHKVTLLTSSVANEGKSFVTCNLGLTLAASGRKTIILELDLRKPSVAKKLQLDTGKKGLCDYLKGTAGIDEIIQQSDLHENLFVISTGTLPGNPAEILEQEKLDNLIEWLRNRFDQILLDSPPLHLVTDAMILSRMADLTLYVVRHNHTSRSELGFVEQLNKENKLPGMNLVFNGVQMDSRYGYSLDTKYYSSSH
ncbi:MAG TPA: polysaccharide biosynthesis tyrosine autokinase [Sphingobacteriaceae bacterium]